MHPSELTSSCRVGQGINESDQGDLTRGLGGNMDDIERALAAMRRGTPCEAAVQHRIEDAVQVVERMLAWHTEQIASSTGHAKLEAAGGMVRVWQMMKSLHRSRYIQRHELEAEVSKPRWPRVRESERENRE